MTKVLIDRAVVEQALGALEKYADENYNGYNADGGYARRVGATLRAALAEQPAEQETLAWLITDGEDCFATNEENYAMDFPESCRKELVERVYKGAIEAAHGIGGQV